MRYCGGSAPRRIGRQADPGRAADTSTAIRDSGRRDRRRPPAEADPDAAGARGHGTGGVPDADRCNDPARSWIDAGHRPADGVGDPDRSVAHGDSVGARAHRDGVRDRPWARVDTPQGPVRARHGPHGAGPDGKIVERGRAEVHPLDDRGRPRVDPDERRTHRADRPDAAGSRRHGLGLQRSDPRDTTGRGVHASQRRGRADCPHARSRQRRSGERGRRSPGRAALASGLCHRRSAWPRAAAADGRPGRRRHPLRRCRPRRPRRRPARLRDRRAFRRPRRSLPASSAGSLARSSDRRHSAPTPRRHRP